MSAIDKIEHVVVLILENHSFDQMLGCMSAVYPDLNGISRKNRFFNVDDKGTKFFQKATDERQMKYDPRHEVEHVATHLENENGGFVLDFVEEYPKAKKEERQNIMGYYKLDSLPGLHQLARNYTVCDRWFSSLAGPTWPNRFFALTGTALGKVDMPDDGTHGADRAGYFQQTQDTIFDRLTEKKIDWKVYFHDIPQTWVLKNQRAPHNAAQYYYIRRFFEDARGAAAGFPKFSLIEPDYLGYIQNDDHPPHDIMKAQKLIADVYNALRGNEELWNSTLFVVFYDEHGGFYDHVVPPPAVPPDDKVAQVKFKDGVVRPFRFNQLGIRVPAILASPWVKAGVLHTQFDHTSLLKFVQDKWDLRPLDSKRVAEAASLEVALVQRSARKNTLLRIDLTADQLKPPNATLEEDAVTTPNDHHIALLKLAEFLPSALWEKTKEKGEETFFEAAPRIYTCLLRPADCAKENLAAFLDWLRGLCEKALALLYKTGDHEVVISSPDKVDQKYTGSRNRVVRFLSTQKPRAIEGLLSRLHSSQNRKDEIHYVRKIAEMAGRKFHHEHLEQYKSWVKREIEKRQ